MPDLTVMPHGLGDNPVRKICLGNVAFFNAASNGDGHAATGKKPIVAGQAIKSGGRVAGGWYSKASAQRRKAVASHCKMENS